MAQLITEAYEYTLTFLVFYFDFFEQMFYFLWKIIDT